VALSCINFARECSGCLDCREEEEIFCPVCDCRVDETLYTNAEGEIIGCENCVFERKI